MYSSENDLTITMLFLIDGSSLVYTAILSVLLLVVFSITVNIPYIIVTIIIVLFCFVLLSKPHTSVLKFICSYRFVSSLYKIVEVSLFCQQQNCCVDNVLCCLCLKLVKNVYLELLHTVFKSYIILNLYAHNSSVLKNPTSEMLNNTLKKSGLLQSVSD